MPRDAASYLSELRRIVLEGPGVTAASLRQAVASQGAVPAELAGFVDKVRRHAYKVTDDDIAALRTAGKSDDEIFEITIATTVGVAIHRTTRALAAAGLPPLEQE